MHCPDDADKALLSPQLRSPSQPLAPGIKRGDEDLGSLAHGDDGTLTDFWMG